MAVAKAIKDAFPQIKVAAFGVYFTMLEKQGLENYPFLDFAFVGEPEDTLDELLAALAAGRRELAAIRGLAWHSPAGIVLNAPRPLIDDLDRLPIPDRSFLKNDRYRLPHNNRVFTLVPTGRGCPYPCTYCIVNAYYGRQARKRSVECIVCEIQECVHQYGIQEFLFWEEVFTLDKDYVLAVCRAIEKAGLKIRWAATTRVTSVEEDVLRAMKRAGCYLLGLGIESGSQMILDNAKKRQTVEDVRRAVACCKKVGIQTMGHFIFGLPGESKETAEQTIRFMLDLDLDYMQCYCAVPYPKTELGELAKAKGWIRADRWSQYDFGGDSIMNTDQLTCEEVTLFRKKAFRRFYFRPALPSPADDPPSLHGPMAADAQVCRLDAGVRLPETSQMTAEVLVSVVIPCLNEEKTIAVCIEKALASFRELKIRGEVVVVDNGSSDRSVELADGGGGQGGARTTCAATAPRLRRGIHEARGKYVVMGDADNTYDYAELGPFVALLDQGADLVIGSRLRGRIHPGAMPWSHRWIGTPVLTFVLNRFFGARISDANCGMRGFRKEAIERLESQADGMEFASEMVIRAAQRRFRIAETPMRLLPQPAGPSAAPALVSRRLAPPALHAHLVSEISVFHPGLDPAPRRRGDDGAVAHGRRGRLPRSVGALLRHV